MKKRKIRNIIIIILVCLAVVFLPYFFFISNNDHESVVDNINNYNYTLKSNDSSYMKEEFENLKSVLEEDNINYEDYAKQLSKLFIIDFYTLNNKLDDSDVGSINYVLPEQIDNFKNAARNSIYRDLLLIDGVKPAVKKVNIENIKDDFYEYNKEKYSSYVVNASWEYEKNNKYDTKAQIVLIKKDNFLYVVEFIPEVSK